MSKSLTFEQADKICSDFAQKLNIQYKRFGTCGFGRDCSGFSQDGHWVAYNPDKASYETPAALNPHKFERVPEFCKADLSPVYEDVPDAYHKDDFLCVLHGTSDLGGFLGGAETDVVIPDAEDMTDTRMQSAVIQLALWVQHMEAVAASAGSELFVGLYNNGYRGMQAMFSGVMNPAIGVR